MTNGRGMVIGDFGRSLGAGMSGGVVYVHDAGERLPLRLNDQLVSAVELDDAGEAEVRALLERHVRFTGSARATVLLEDWERERVHFRRIAPKAEVATIENEAEGTHGAGEEKEAKKKEKAAAGVAG